jgi:hypothetical protein
MKQETIRYVIECEDEAQARLWYACAMTMTQVFKYALLAAYGFKEYAPLEILERCEIDMYEVEDQAWFVVIGPKDADVVRELTCEELEEEAIELDLP